MADSRRSLIVMLPADLVDRLDSRSAELAQRGEVHARDELIAQAVEHWLAASPPSAASGGRALSRPDAIDAILRRAADDVEHLSADVREASGRRGRAIDDLAARLRDAAVARDRDTFVALGDGLASVQALLRRGLDDGLDELSALTREASALVLAAQPRLPDDARSRWMSAQAGRGLAPDRVVRSAELVGLAVGLQAKVAAAAQDAAESVPRSRASVAAHLGRHEVSSSDLRLDDDVDDETWGYAAQVAASRVATTLATQRSVIDVGLDHALAVARTHLDILGLHARELAITLAGVPNPEGAL